LLEKALELAKGGDVKGATKLLQEYTERVIGKELEDGSDETAV
jgi:hypothetical protein